MTLRILCDKCNKQLDRTEGFFTIEHSGGSCFRQKHLCHECFNLMAKAKLLDLLNIGERHDTTKQTKKNIS